MYGTVYHETARSKSAQINEMETKKEAHDHKRFLILLTTVNMTTATLFLLIALAVAVVYALPSDFVTEDIFIPTECVKIAKPGDHILLEYAVLFSNGSTGASLKRPSQLYHVLLESSVS